MAWNPAQYERFADERAQPFHDLLSLLRPRPIRRAIDLGCGTGKLTRILHERIAPTESTLGVDSSGEMLAEAARVTTDCLRFESVDLTAWEPARGAYDLVFTNAALQWIPDHERLIPRVLDAVSESGQFAMQVPANMDHPSHVIAGEVAHRLFPAAFPSADPPIRVLPVERYAQMLYANGFPARGIVARVQVYGHPMESGRDVIEWVKGTLLTRYAEVLGPERFADFLAAYSRELLAVIGESPYYYPFKRILVRGDRGVE